MEKEDKNRATPVSGPWAPEQLLSSSFFCSDAKPTSSPGWKESSGCFRPEPKPPLLTKPPSWEGSLLGAADRLHPNHRTSAAVLSTLVGRSECQPLEGQGHDWIICPPAQHRVRQIELPQQRLKRTRSEACTRVPIA